MLGNQIEGNKGNITIFKQICFPHYRLSEIALGKGGSHAFIFNEERNILMHHI